MDDEEIEKRLRDRAQNAACVSVFLVLLVLGLTFFVVALFARGGA